MNTNMRRTRTTSRAMLAFFLASLCGPHAAWAQSVASGAAVRPVSPVSAIGAVLPTGMTTLPASFSAATLTPLTGIGATPAVTPISAASAQPLTPAVIANAKPFAVPAAAAAKALKTGAETLSAAAVKPGASADSLHAANAKLFDGSNASASDAASVAGSLNPAASRLLPSRMSAAGETPASKDSEPTDAEYRRYRAEISARVTMGSVVTASIKEAMDKAVGVSAFKGAIILDALAAEGVVIRASSRRYVTSRLWKGHAGQAEHDAARKLAVEGIRLSNTRASGSHLRAMVMIGSAMRRLKEFPGADALDAQVAFQNASVLAVRQLLREYDGQLEKRGKAQDSPERMRVAEADDQLAEIVYTKDGSDKELSSTAAAWLSNFVSSRKLSDETRATEHGAQLEMGLALLQAHAADGSLPDEDGSPLANADPNAGWLSGPNRDDKGGNNLSSNNNGDNLPARREKDPKKEGLIEKNDSSYKAINEFGSNLTMDAADGKLMPLIGRKAELRQAVKTLLRLKKNNPMFIGEPGVGKTVMAEGLAQAIVNGDIPELKGKNIYKLDMTKLVAGTQYRGQFEERIKNVLEEVKKSQGRVILFIDEIHTIIGAGSASGSQDAANILKEALADGSISVIGSTTLEEFRKIEKDAALARRFNKIMLLAPTKDEAVQIVEGVKKFYEAKHGMTVSAATVKTLVDFATRYITDRQLPDSALDLLDDAGAEVKVQRSEAKKDGKEGRTEVVPEDIAFEIAKRTGIPVGKIGADEREQLKNLPKELAAQVVGQDEAVTKVSKGVQRGRLGMKNAKQPTGAFVFLGPTGVGKTEIARATAKVVFGSEKNMVRLDMSEYQEEHSVARLFGAPPGYVGHEDAGQLTEKIRRQPYSVILLDEIEKAHPKVMDALLQVLEDGRLTDGQGKTVDFSNTIIMMTSNLGGSLSGEEKKDEEPRRRIGFVLDDEEPKAKIQASNEDPAARRKRYMDALRAKYRPEFINRIGEDAVIVFNELGEAQLKDILELRIRDLQNQLKDKNVTLSLTTGARVEVLRRAVEQKAYGARPLKQTLERQVSDAVSEAYLEGTVADGDAVTVDWDASKSMFVATKTQKN